MESVGSLESLEWIELSPRRQSAIWYTPNLNRKKTLAMNDADYRQHLRPNINTLPDIMVLQILSFLPPSSLGVTAQVSR